MRIGSGLALLLVGVLCACAGDYGRRYQRAHPDFGPARLSAGMPFDASVATLYLDPGPDASVDVDEIRVLALDVDPWEAIPLDDAHVRTGRVGLIAGRRCSIRDGWRLREIEAASWMVFVDGRLEAFGHDAFDASCTPVQEFRPAREALVDAERGLVRYVGQRYPRVRPAPLELAAQGFAYLEVGRLLEVRHVLRGLDRTIDQVEIQRETDYELDEAGIAELERLEAQLRTERARLRRALRAFEEAETE